MKKERQALEEQQQQPQQQQQQQQRQRQQEQKKTKNKNENEKNKRKKTSMTSVRSCSSHDNGGFDGIHDDNNDNDRLKNPTIPSSVECQHQQVSTYSTIRTSDRDNDLIDDCKNERSTTTITTTNTRDYQETISEYWETEFRRGSDLNKSTVSDITNNVTIYNNNNNNNNVSEDFQRDNDDGYDNYDNTVNQKNNFHNNDNNIQQEDEVTINNQNNHHPPSHTNHILPTAEIIDSNTETIVFATEEKNKILILKRNINQIFIIFIGVLFVGGIVILWRASSKGDSIHNEVGDRRCWNSSLDEQNAAMQCYCTGTAQAAVDNLPPFAFKIIEHTVNVLTNHSIIPSNDVSIGKCDSINLALLMMASSPASLMGKGKVHKFVPKVVIQFYMLSYIYVTMNGIHWNDTTNWFTTMEFCSWHGIDCSFLLLISKISLSNNNLVGTIPSEIQYMAELIEFDISFNPGIIGTIPTQLMQLTSLHVLNLSNLNLNGTIPYQLNKLHRLRILSLHNNNLIGTIPSKLFLNTTNRTTDDDIDNNYNTNTGDTDDDSLQQSLTVLNLENNLLSGTIPKEISYVTNLINLQLSNNYLEGTIPIEISKLTLLEFLSIANNQFSSSQNILRKMMMIPNELGYLPYLKYITLHQSGFSNKIPESFCTYNNKNDNNNNNIMIKSNNNPKGFQRGINHTTTTTKRGTRYIVIDCDLDHNKNNNNNNNTKIDYCSCCNEGSTSLNKNNKSASIIYIICSKDVIKKTNN